MRFKTTQLNLKFLDGRGSSQHIPCKSLISDPLHEKEKKLLFPMVISKRTDRCHSELTIPYSTKNYL